MADHEHRVRWNIDPYEEKPGGTYIGIEPWLDCGCAINDLKVFAAQMQAQRGWHMVTSGGWGSSGGVGEQKRYSVRARRTTVK
ncbi:hypothetical protein GCM10023191_030380 [Actinoallomurus oryzae]|uniref:Uncharacterized protein n=1 Tax=Actinoallomurus oryzae TaxID=502180 RepID=A0ABP8PVT0_9ACTN